MVSSRYSPNFHFPFPRTRGNNFTPLGMTDRFTPFASLRRPVIYWRPSAYIEHGSRAFCSYLDPRTRCATSFIGRDIVKTRTARQKNLTKIIDNYE